MITLIGNALNSTNKKVLDKMHKMDFNFVEREVFSQIQHGAQYIELSASPLLDNEIPFLKKAIPIVERCGGKALVRSDNIDSLVEAVKVSNSEILIGDVEYDTKKIDRVLGYLKEKDVKIIALVREDGKKSDFSPERSLLIAQMYIDYLLDHGIRRSDILLDPIVRPLEDNFLNGRIFLNTLELFKLDFPQVKTIANLSALSEGLPRKNLLSAHFVSLALEKGVDYMVLNVLDKAILESIITTMTIIGKDRNMHSYLTFCRNSKEKKKEGN